MNASTIDLLAQAVNEADAQALRARLTAGDDPNAPCPHHRDCALLHVAAWRGLSDIVRLLIEHGADIYCRDAYQQTPAHHLPNAATARVLLKAGADPNVSDDWGWTPTHNAILSAQLEVLGAMHDHGGDPQLRTFGGESPMELARSVGLEDLVTEIEAAILRQSAGERRMGSPADEGTGALGL